MLCGIVIGSTSSAFAAIGDIVEAQFSKFVIRVDGDEKTLDADPLVYQGTTYLPVRTIANLLGKDVVYKADTRTIELNTPISTAKEGNQIVTDFRMYSPEIINGQITALEATLKQETNLEAMAKLKSAIEERKAYLEQIGETQSKDNFQEQLNAINIRIEATKRMLELAPDNEEYKNALTELETKKSELEIQLGNK